MFPEECTRPSIFVDSKRVAEAIEAGWMLIGYALGVASGLVGWVIASTGCNWSKGATQRISR